MTQVKPADKQTGNETSCGLPKLGINSLERWTLGSVKQFHQTSHCNPWGGTRNNHSIGGI